MYIEIERRCKCSYEYTESNGGSVAELLLKDISNCI